MAKGGVVPSASYLTENVPGPAPYVKTVFASSIHVTRKHTWKHHISTEDLTRRLGLDTADFYV